MKTKKRKSLLKALLACSCALFMSTSPAYLFALDIPTPGPAAPFAESGAEIPAAPTPEAVPTLAPAVPTPEAVPTLAPAVPTPGLLANDAPAGAPIPAPAGTGVISGEVRNLPNNIARDYYGTTGIKPAMVNLYLYNAYKVFLLDENQNVIKDTTTGPVSGVGGEFRFDGLPNGTYYVRIENTANHLLLKSINATGHQLDYTTAAIVLDDANHTKSGLWWVLVKRPWRFATTTTIGSFPGSTNPQEKVYFPGGMTVSSTGLNSFNGILDGDKPNDKKIATLQKPTLTSAERAYGYYFLGWRLPGSDEILEDQAVLDIKVQSDVSYEAVFGFPSHTVTFATNIDYGLINGDAETSFTFDGNLSTVPSIPPVTAKPGFEFIGWYKDLTTNVISNSTILSKPVNGSMTYYAKYKLLNTLDKTHLVRFDAGTDGVVLDADRITVKYGSYLPSVPQVKANAGKVFVGWSLNGTTYPDDFSLTANNMVLSDLTFVAVYKDAPPSSEPTGSGTNQTTAAPTTSSSSVKTTTIGTTTSTAATTPGVNTPATTTKFPLPSTGEVAELWPFILGGALLVLALAAIAVKLRRRDTR